MTNPFRSVLNFLDDHFNLSSDQADQAVIIKSVHDNIEFKGANLWALIFAIFIASIGLNVNSTAVVIGAMLISPIMGPIMGVGLGISIFDIQLLKKSAKNLLIATLIGVITSAIYFYISPLDQAHTELVSRTSPSLFDVLIAFFGGGAGMVAASRKEKNNVIPGVAIATALMPPLCTAGFGIANGNWYYFFGAIYLYFINSVFIALSTYLVARYLKMKKFRSESLSEQRKINTYVILIVTVTIIPSIYFAYRIVEKNIFEINAQKFVKEQFTYDNTQVISKDFIFEKKNINLLLVGKILNGKTIDSLKENLTTYNLNGAHLNIRQGLNELRHIDFAQIRTSILDNSGIAAMPDTSETSTTKVSKRVVKDTSVFAELKVLYPSITSYGLTKTIVYHAGDVPADTLKIALTSFKGAINNADREKLQSFLRVRYRSASLQLVVH